MRYFCRSVGCPSYPWQASYAPHPMDTCNADERHLDREYDLTCADRCEGSFSSDGAQAESLLEGVHAQLQRVAKQLADERAAVDKLRLRANDLHAQLSAVARNHERAESQSAFLSQMIRWVRTSAAEAKATHDRIDRRGTSCCGAVADLAARILAETDAFV